MSHLFPLTALGEIAQTSFIDLGLLISIYPVSARNGQLTVISINGPWVENRFWIRSVYSVDLFWVSELG